jgi:hypothetical protein
VGAQIDFVDSLKQNLGVDTMWWLIPTRPVLETNYYERVWTTRELRKSNKENKTLEDKDIYDSD